MHGMDGFDVLENLTSRPPVVFVTADALDYPLKPVEPEPLACAVGRLRFRQPSSILAEDELVFAATGDGRFLWNATLRDLDSRLYPAHFIRVHESAIVNLHHCAEIDPDSHYNGGLRPLWPDVGTQPPLRRPASRTPGLIRNPFTPISISLRHFFKVPCRAAQPKVPRRPSNPSVTTLRRGSSTSPPPVPAAEASVSFCTLFRLIHNFSTGCFLGIWMVNILIRESQAICKVCFPTHPVLRNSRSTDRLRDGRMVEFPGRSSRAFAARAGSSS